MDKIITIHGKTIPLAMNNVDTDLIIPAQYLTSVSKKGYGENLFRRLKESDPDFVFNQAKFNGARILIAKENFGCGSSREHAVWALKQAGIDAVIAVSYSDIFFNNAGKNGLILLTQPLEVIDQLLAHAQSGTYEITVDLDQQQIKTPNGNFSFTMDAFNRHCFMHGLDELDYLLAHLPQIDAYKKQ